jgi:hypothetical protein
MARASRHETREEGPFTHRPDEMVANRLVASTVQHLTTIPRPAVSCWSLADSRPDIPRKCRVEPPSGLPSRRDRPSPSSSRPLQTSRRVRIPLYRRTAAPITARHGTAQYEVDSDPMDTHCAATTSSTAAA